MRGNTRRQKVQDNYYHVYEEDGFWYWRLMSKRRPIPICQSSFGYSKKDGVLKALYRLRKAAATTPIVVREKGKYEDLR